MVDFPLAQLEATQLESSPGLPDSESMPFPHHCHLQCCAPLWLNALSCVFVMGVGLPRASRPLQCDPSPLHMLVPGHSSVSCPVLGRPLSLSS